MRTFHVELGPDAHPVHVGAGALDRTGRLAREAGLTAGRALIVTDSNVARLYGERAAASLAAAKPARSPTTPPPSANTALLRSSSASTIAS